MQGKVVKSIPPAVPLFHDVPPSLAADVTSLWMYYQLFGEPLRLSTFALDDFAHALLYPGGDSSLITQCVLSTFKLLMKDEKSRARRAAADPNNAVIFERRKERNLDQADEDDKAAAAAKVPDGSFLPNWHVAVIVVLIFRLVCVCLISVWFMSGFCLIDV